MSGIMFRPPSERPEDGKDVVINLGSEGVPVLKDGTYRDESAAFVDVLGRPVYWADVTGWLYQWEQLPWGGVE